MIRFDSMIVGLFESSDCDDKEEEVDSEDDGDDVDLIDVDTVVADDDDDDDGSVVIFASSVFVSIVADDNVLDDTIGRVNCDSFGFDVFLGYFFEFSTWRFNCPCVILDATTGSGSSSQSKSSDIFIPKFLMETAFFL